MKNHFLLFVCIFSFFSPALAQVSVLKIEGTNNDKLHLLQPFCQIWVDTSSKKTIEEVLKAPIQE